MEKFFLGSLFSCQELNIINKKHINVTISSAELNHFIVSNRVDHLVRELLSRDIGNSKIRSLGNKIPNRTEQMCFYQARRLRI